MMKTKWQRCVMLGCTLVIGLVVMAGGGVGRVAQVEAQSTTRIDLGEEASAGMPSSGLAKFSKDVLTSFLMAVYGELSGTEFVSNGNTGEYSVLIHEDKGALVALGRGIGQLYDLPVSGTNYIASSLGDMGLEVAPKAQAQGYGFYALDAIQDIWRIFRNVAYVFLTILVLVVGFMILFQQKLDGSLVLTVQKALPNIILAMVLVTFSYAIAGLLIDAMYILMFLFGGLFKWKAGGMADLMGDSIWGLGGKMIGGGASSVWSITGALFNPFDGGSMTWNDNGFQIDGFLKWFFVDLILGGIIGLLLGLIVMIVIIVAMIIAVFKLFFQLVKYYAIIVFDVIFAPILLMLGAIPGIGFSKWFKSLIGNLSAFVTIFVVMTVYYFIVALAGGKTEIGQQQDGLVGTVEAAGDYFFAPPFAVGSPQENQKQLALSVLGLGILLVLPELVTRVRKQLGGEAGFLGEMAKAAVSNPAIAGAAKFVDDQVGGTFRGAAGAAIGAAGGAVAGTVKGQYLGSRIARGNRGAAIKDARARYATGAITAAQRDALIKTARSDYKTSVAHTRRQSRQEAVLASSTAKAKQMGGSSMLTTFAATRKTDENIFWRYHLVAANITNPTNGYPALDRDRAQAWIARYEGYDPPTPGTYVINRKRDDYESQFLSWQNEGKQSPGTMIGGGAFGDT